MVPVHAVPFDASGALPILHLHTLPLPHTASLAVPMTLNESEVIDDGSEVEMDDGLQTGPRLFYLIDTPPMIEIPVMEDGVVYGCSSVITIESM